MSDGSALLLGAATSLVVAALVMTLTVIVAGRQGRVVVVDTAWGLGFVAITVLAAALAAILGDGEPWRIAVLVALVGLWGLRLAWHLLRRNHSGEDPRYEKMLGGTLAEVGLGVAVRKVFAVQGVAMAFIALPAAVGVLAEVRWAWVVALGVLVWALGLVFEAVGDAQLAAYKRIPKQERPQVLDTGLWRYTRHPNYFGDACVWWGIWLAGGLASGWVVGLATVLAPVAMSFFLVEATGAKLLERTMMQRPGYPEYAARTSKFVPLPPRKPHSPA
ncbi:DUF1295 domain-containing protein [Nocardioides sambongensis]|uniref:DUF1295 domain-containing protein n=1 Tax=Nocardioides sambongensis TaxID=2589074 RepID=UPI001126EBBE|nr:DUF1295 domain-containing protein [Nocardioides sambongensis]